MSEETHRTPSQDDAVKKAWDLISEHFDRALLVVDVECEDGDDGHQVFWHGGFLAGLGAAEYAKHHLLHGKQDTSEP